MDFSIMRKLNLLVCLSLCVAGVALANTGQLSNQLIETIESLYPEAGLNALILPASNDYSAIPQDPRNPITREKVTLGRFLYHETRSGTEGTSADRTETWSCASCHHVDAGFKAGIPQGIGDGGTGFGHAGEARKLQHGLDANAEVGSPLKPDVQPIASPTILNTAYQDLMLWNGSFGNSAGSNNSHVPARDKAGPAAILANTFELSGHETQVLAGTNVHRLRFDHDSFMQTDSTYRYLYNQAFANGGEGLVPQNGTTVTPQALGAAKAIAAYERVVLSNFAPFQLWLQGDRGALSEEQLRGGLLFFGKAECANCHAGPALSSPAGATEDQMFFSIGFNDFSPDDRQIHGAIDEKTKLGRGGFTGIESDNYKFKIPQLYNLADSNVFGHGASFKSVRQVIEYKNRAKAQNRAATNLSVHFRPLELNHTEISDLTAFIEEALYDSWLERYVPSKLPENNCFPVADMQSAIDLGCIFSSDTASSEDQCMDASSDPDGDGWGWEDNASCRVSGETSSNASVPVSDSTATPNCTSSVSDPDGDGWGWENNRSCRVLSNGPAETKPSGNKRYCRSAQSDPDGDGWGWENNRSCIVP